MKCKIPERGVLWLLLIMLILATGVFISPRSAAALSIYDYFVINYDTEFSKDEIDGSEVFYATVSGTADCKQDLPLTVSNGYITSRVVAQHRESGHKITLNPSYTINIEPFPNEKGGTTEAHVVISLKFPPGSQAGAYDIAGELIEAKVQSTFGFWFTVTPYLPSTEELGSISYVPGDEDEDAVTIGSVFSLSSYLDNGISTRDFIFQADDARCQLMVKEDTLCLTEDGEPLSELTMSEMGDPPTPPGGSDIIGLIYHLGPDRATFDPPLTLTLAYDEPMIPAGMAEDDLVIAMWDETNDDWVILKDSMVDPSTDTISVAISHFSAFTILAPTPVLSPANFILSSLTIAPEEAESGEEIAISVLVINTGDLEGTYTVVLKIDDAVEATGDIPLADGSRQTVSFTTTKSIAGTYNVNVNGLSGTFEVKGAPPATLPTEVNWWLIGVIIAAIATGITVPLVLRQRRRRT